MWHFYEGDALNMYIINPDGQLNHIQLGNRIEKGQQFQAIVPKDHWFAVELSKEGHFGLVGCTTAPGFDYDDLSLGEENELCRLFPQHSKLIKRLTRK